MFTGFRTWSVIQHNTQTLSYSLFWEFMFTFLFWCNRYWQMCSWISSAVFFCQKQLKINITFLYINHTCTGFSKNTMVQFIKARPTWVKPFLAVFIRLWSFRKQTLSPTGSSLFTEATIREVCVEYWSPFRFSALFSWSNCVIESNAGKLTFKYHSFKMASSCGISHPGHLFALYQKTQVVNFILDHVVLFLPFEILLRTWQIL